MTRIRDLSIDEKPKERLIQFGSQVLSNTELLAILINTGSRGHSSIDIASNMLSQCQSLSQIKNLSLAELESFEGIGRNKAVTLLSVFEICQRLAREKTRTLSEPIHTPQQIAERFYPKFNGCHQEHFVLIILNTKHQIIHEQTLFIGTLNSAVIHPREIFKTALKWSAHAIIVLHNHPSGDPTPSKADIETTKRLIVCGEAMGIDVLDHIIVGDSNYVSILSEIDL
ncbi:RadC family protein [Staphylococcus schleiferi]|uniref:RadC family protein n=1 Tax=Staphylococcus schleiferi TaxID=1295 RepID=UPI0024814FFF|nr:DNA repair protein RadC [Staphylococcus schleiferi]